MGAWGVAIFSDDDAADVRADWRNAILDGLSAEDATDQLVESFQPRPDDTVFWLGLAAAQMETGRLLDRVRDRAVKIINEGSDLARWEDEVDARARERVLLRLRARLLGPQLHPKRLRRSGSDLDSAEALALDPRHETGVEHYAAARRSDSAVGDRMMLGATLGLALRHEMIAEFATDSWISMRHGGVTIKIGIDEWHISARGEWTHAAYALEVLTVFQRAASRAIGTSWPPGGGEPHTEVRGNEVFGWYGDEETATVSVRAHVSGG